VLLPLVRRPRLEVVIASSAVEAPAALPIPAAFAANLGLPWRIRVVERGGKRGAIGNPNGTASNTGHRPRLAPLKLVVACIASL